MRVIEVDASPEVVLSRMRVLATRLRTRKDTQDLVPPVQSARNTLKACVEAASEATDDKIACTGTIAFLDDEEDNEIAGLARSARVLVDGKLMSPIYRRLFFVAPSIATAGIASDEQEKFALHILDTLKTEEAYASLASFIPGLEAARAAVAAEQERHKTLVTAESAAVTELENAKTLCREVYRDTYPALLLKFPGRKRLVDSFFYSPRKRKGKSKRTVVEVSVDQGDDGDDDT